MYYPWETWHLRRGGERRTTLQPAEAGQRQRKKNADRIYRMKDLTSLHILRDGGGECCYFPGEGNVNWAIALRGVKEEKTDLASYSVPRDGGGETDRRKELRQIAGISREGIHGGKVIRKLGRTYLPQVDSGGGGRTPGDRRENEREGEDGKLREMRGKKSGKGDRRICVQSAWAIRMTHSPAFPKTQKNKEKRGRGPVSNGLRKSDERKGRE